MMKKHTEKPQERLFYLFHQLRASKNVKYTTNFGLCVPYIFILRKNPVAISRQPQLNQKNLDAL